MAKQKTRRKTPAPLLWAWRVVWPDFRSRGDFRWPFPGNWAEASGPFEKNGEPCPSAEGDGVCLAKTWAGAASGGIPARTVLVCGYYADDVLGEDEDKIRVKRAFVSEVWDAERLVREAGGRADLRGADLRRADLRRADLRGADLGGANLRRADLRGADLGGADLRSANLGRADLGRANLRGADLGGAFADPWTTWPANFKPEGVVQC